jgi:hypothetical protein
VAASRWGGWLCPIWSRLGFPLSGCLYT